MVSFTPCVLYIIFCDWWIDWCILGFKQTKLFLLQIHGFIVFSFKDLIKSCLLALGLELPAQ